MEVGVLYLATTMSPVEKVDSKLQHIFPRKKNRQCNKASVNTLSININNDEYLSEWWYPTNPNRISETDRKMIAGCLIEKMVQTVFTSRFYMWDERMDLQQEGSPMSLRSSCPVSRAMMDHWVTKVREVEEKSHTLHLLEPSRYARLELAELSKYVDYILSALNKMPRGT